MRRETTRPEDDVLPDGVRVSANVPRRSLGGGTGMDPNPREVVAEALLHLPAEGRMQGRPRLGKGAPDARRLSVLPPGGRNCVTLDAWRRRSGCGIWLGNHHLLGDPVGLCLEGITPGTERELALQGASVAVLACVAQRPF